MFSCKIIPKVHNEESLLREFQPCDIGNHPQSSETMNKVQPLSSKPNSLIILRALSLGICTVGCLIVGTPWFINDLEAGFAQKVQLFGAGLACVFGCLVVLLSYLAKKKFTAIPYGWHIAPVGSFILGVWCVLSIYDTVNREDWGEMDPNLKSIALGLRNYEEAAREIEWMKNPDKIRRHLLSIARSDDREMLLKEFYQDHKEIIKRHWTLIQIVPSSNTFSINDRAAFALCIMYLAEMFKADGDPSLLKDLAGENTASVP